MFIHLFTYSFECAGAQAGPESPDEGAPRPKLLAMSDSDGDGLGDSGSMPDDSGERYQMSQAQAQAWQASQGRAVGQEEFRSRAGSSRSTAGLGTTDVSCGVTKQQVQWH
jgi:hypothetical protein